MLTTTFQETSVVREVILSSTTAVNLSTLFSSGDWNSSIRKRVIVPAGVTIGSTSVSTPAIDTSSSWSGILELVVYGNVDGAGGSAGGGTGGDALKVQGAGSVFVLRGTGNIRSGGGGGGTGGKGGDGSYPNTYTLYDPGPGSGDFTTASNHYWAYWPGNGKLWVYFQQTFEGYAAGSISDGSADTRTSYTPNAWTYYKGYATQVNVNTLNYYAIRRTRSQTDTINVTGAGGGNGGRGQGYDGSSVTGSTGGNNGSSSGIGGTGGTGGEFGSSGSNGNTGAVGSVTAGVAGTAGGSAGYGINGISTIITNEFRGSLLGLTGG